MRVVLTGGHTTATGVVGLSAFSSRASHPRCIPNRVRRRTPLRTLRRRDSDGVRIASKKRGPKGVALGTFRSDAPRRGSERENPQRFHLREVAGK